MDKVSKEEIRKNDDSKVLPAIREKFLKREKLCTIYIQQDNAKPHLTNKYFALQEELLKMVGVYY